MRHENGSLNSTEKELDDSYACLTQFSCEVLLPAVVNHRLGSELSLTTTPDYLVPLVFGMVTAVNITCPTIINR